MELIQSSRGITVIEFSAIRLAISVLSFNSCSVVILSRTFSPQKSNSFHTAQGMVGSAFSSLVSAFFFNDTATTEIYTLSLHDALPTCPASGCGRPIAFDHKKLVIVD